MTRTLTIALLALSLGGCGTLDRIADIGTGPDMSPVGDMNTPQRQASLAYSNLANPLPSDGASPAASRDTSLWRTGSRAFFRDQRAAEVGDILTIKVQISDSAQVGNTTTRTRTNSETAALNNLLGLESKLNKILPGAVDPTSLIDGSSDSSVVGNGAVNRSEQIDLTLAAIVTRVLPNGNLAIQGRQEVRVNFEVRELVVQGIVRPEDIGTDNTVAHTQIAEARISYGGRGQLTDVQQARYGQQLYDILFPF